MMERQAAMFEGWTVRKTYLLSGIALLVSYVEIVLIVNMIRSLDISSLEPLIAVAVFIVSWLPLLGLILMCLLYNINLVSNKYIAIRRKCYFGVLTFILALSFIFMPQKVFVSLNIYVVDLIIAFLGIVNLMLHYNIEEILNKKNFSISRELRVLKRIEEKRTRETQSLKYERYLLLFLIVYIPPHNNMFFIVGSITIAIFLILPLMNIVNYYESIREIIKMNSRWIYVNHFALIGLSIPLYIFLDTSFPAFICSYASSYLIYELRLRHSRYLYIKVEQTLNLT
jgi:hypothetical protein